MGVEVRIEKAYMIREGEGKKIIVATEKWEMKRQIMMKKRELEKGIYIEDDLTKKERKIQGIIRRIAKEEKERRKLWNKIWKGGRIPKEWRKGVICPIFKKGDKKDAKNYRGVTLMDTAYKVYAVSKKLRKRIMETYKETKNVVKIGERYTEEF